VRVNGLRELRENLSAVLDGGEPVLVTRHGKLSGLYLPLDDPNHIPTDLRRELAGVLGRYLAGLLDAQGATEEEIQEDFDAHRRRRR
jgi:antitoxin (DNA-binding transcriptional repressor) of toxin-antitoxin stability system